MNSLLSKIFLDDTIFLTLIVQRIFKPYLVIIKTKIKVIF